METSSDAVDFNEQLRRPRLHDSMWSSTRIQGKATECLLRRSSVLTSSNTTNEESSFQSTTENGKHETDCQRPVNKHLLIGTIFVVLLCILAECCFPPLAAEERGYWQLKNSLKNLQLSFPNQTEQFWVASLAAAKPVLLQKMPKHPGVILIAGSKSSSVTADCLAQKISEAVNKALEVNANVVILDSHKYKDLTPDNVKHQLSDRFKTEYEMGARAVVLLGIESLPGNSPIVLHQLCDTANAPFKKVIIILTLNMEVSSGSEKEEAYDELRRLWEPVFDQKRFEQMFSQIANSVVYVRVEKDKQACNLGHKPNE